MKRAQRTWVGCLFALAVLMGTAGPAWAAGPVDLTERVPDGALLYFGWAGCSYEKTAAEGTALGKIIAEPQVRRFFKDLDGALDGMLRQLAAQEEATPVYEAARRMVFDLFLKPGAFTLIDGGFGEAGPFVQAGLVLKLDDRAPGFVKDLQTILAVSPMPPPEAMPVGEWELQQLFVPVPGGVYFGAVDGYFVFAIGQDTVQTLLGKAPAGTTMLAQSPKLTVPRERIGGKANGRVATLYLNLAGVLERARALMPMFAPDPEWQGQVDGIINALGLDGVQSVCWELYYQDEGCYSGLFVHTDGAPRGLLAAGGTDKVTKQDLQLIPESPFWATVFGMNPGKIYDDAMAAFAKLQPEGHQELSEFLVEIGDDLGLRLDADLIDLLGGKFIVYDAPENGGLWFTGITVIAESPDPAKLQANVKTLVQGLARKLAEETDEAKLSLASTTYREHKIEFVNLTGVPMPVAPAWTAHEGRLILGLYPQMVMAALDRMAGNTPGPSLADNADFKKAVGVLDGVGSTVSYVDSRRGAQQLYAIALPLLQVGAAMGQGEGLDIDIASFPTQQALTRHLFSQVATTHRKADGVLYANYGPLPLAMTGVGEGAGAATALGVSVLLPSLARARELAKRNVSLANLKQIGVACIVHASEDSRERLPANLQVLIEEGNVSEKTLYAPADQTGEISYVYLGGSDIALSRINNPWQFILAHERTDVNEGAGVAAVFADGHAEFLRPERFEELVLQTKAELKEMRTRVE